MALKLPEPGTPTKRPKTVTTTTEDLLPGDTIEYGITMEVSPKRGQKAWIKFGTTSSVREGESTEQARSRVCTYVEKALDQRLDELA